MISTFRSASPPSPVPTFNDRARRAEICDYFKIAPDIYLSTWREKIIPTVGVILINLSDMRSNGKIFGLDLASGNIVNFTMGSRAEF